MTSSVRRKVDGWHELKELTGSRAKVPCRLRFKIHPNPNQTLTIGSTLRSAGFVWLAGEHCARDVPGDAHDYLVARARLGGPPAPADVHPPARRRSGQAVQADVADRPSDARVGYVATGALLRLGARCISSANRIPTARSNAAYACPADRRSRMPARVRESHYRDIRLCGTASLRAWARNEANSRHPGGSRCNPSARQLAVQ
jgi:hypothetical protein